MRGRGDADGADGTGRPNSRATGRRSTGSACDGFASAAGAPTDAAFGACSLAAGTTAVDGEGDADVDADIDTALAEAGVAAALAAVAVVDAIGAGDATTAEAGLAVTPRGSLSAARCDHQASTPAARARPAASASQAPLSPRSPRAAGAAAR
ncbi:MAG TPA: hypothetical protein VII31_05785 [Caldimonas sp.]